MNKKLIATAVGASLAATAGAVQANTFLKVYPYHLIPYVVKDANRTTVVTLVDIKAQTSGATVHLQYWTKSTTDANTAACQPSSVTIPVTENDIMTFDTAGLLGYPLFGDTTNPAPLGTSIAFAAPRHGYLIADARQGSALISTSYWLELDLANGGAHGDIGQHNDFGPQIDPVDGNFGAPISSIYPGPANSLWPIHILNRFEYATAVNFWPTSVASTAFTVTPTGTAMLTRENNQVVMQVFNDNQVQGAYDRNENGVDGTVPVTVRCVGRVTPAQLMPGVVANAAWAAQGGWGRLANLGENVASNYPSAQTPSSSGDMAAIVYQVDSASVGGKFMTNATRIVSGEYLPHPLN